MAIIDRYNTKTLRTFEIGDIGPGGGIIFITPTTAGNTTGKYFEAAPYGWNTGADPLRSWAQSSPTNYQTTSVTGADGGDIGTGYQNTLDIIAQGNSTTSTSAAALARSCRAGGKDDWFLPSYGEMSLLALFNEYNLLILDTKTYWSSTEYSSSEGTGVLYATGGFPNMWIDYKSIQFAVRPVRMFRVEYSTSVQRIGNESVYGGGQDGTVVIASNTSLTRDMYYNNLTINNGAYLNTNGFKIFVKNKLTVNGLVGINAGITANTGTVSGTPAVATSTTNSIGGNAAGVTYVASQASSSVRSYIENVLNGGSVDVTGVFNPFTGGAGGENGAAGTVTPATAGAGAGTAPTTWPGQAGTLTRNVGVPAGPGTAGTNGTNGAAGSTPPAASAGAGGRGGGVVAIIARMITGTGTGSIISNASHATNGGNAATGSGATNGAAGAAGHSALAASIAHYTQSHAQYITGDGTHGPHAHVAAPVLPSSYVPAASANHAHGYWIHTSHDASCVYPANSHGGSSPHTNPNIPHHTHYTPAPATSDYYTQGSIDHTAGGHLGHDGAVAHGFTHTSAAQGHNDYTETDTCPDIAYKGGHIPGGTETRPRRDRWGYHNNGNYRNAGASRTVGHMSKASGAGGPGGTAGSNGTNGSTTAGTAGKSGGGGGIFIVTDSTPIGVTTSVSGGTIGGVSGSSGNVITILNA